MSRMELSEMLRDVRVIFAVVGAIIAGTASVGIDSLLVNPDPHAAVEKRLDSVEGALHGIEQWRADTIGPSVRFLACSQWKETRGEDPRTCEDLMRGLRDFIPSGAP